MEGTFTVKETFSTASGKFGIVEVNQYVYLDIRYAFQQIIKQTLNDDLDS